MREKEKIILLKKVNCIISESNSAAEIGEKLLLDYIKVNPGDTDILFNLAILEINLLLDLPRAISYLEQIWFANNDIKAIIYIVVLEDIHTIVSSKYFKILKEYVTEDSSLTAMINYCMALYFKSINDIDNAIQSFLFSVNANSSFVRAYVELGYIYENSNHDLSKKYYTKAIEGVRRVLTMDELENIDNSYNWLSVDKFEEESILGCELTQPTYDYFVSLTN